MDQKKRFLFVLIANPNGFKVSVVIKKLMLNHTFTSGNCLVVTTSEEGALSSVAKLNGLKVLVTNRKDLATKLAQYHFDYLISCGWNYKIPDNVIAMAAVAALNCHSSYLPDYKGASAHKHAWANAEPHTGATIHLLSSDFDGGNIIEQSKIKISWFDTPKSLIRKIADETAEMLPRALLKTENNDFGFSQNDITGRYFFKTSNHKFVLHRIINLLISPLGKKYYTKNKEV